MVRSSAARRIGYSHLKGLYGVLLLLCATTVPAGASGAAVFTCRAEVNRTSVPQGGAILLTVVAEGDVSWTADFQVPDIPGVQISGAGSNNSASFVNGQTMTTAARSYYLQVDTDHDFTIGGIVIDSDGHTCTTDPITITVTPEETEPIPPANTGNRVVAPPQTSRNEDLAAGQAGDEVFITLEADAREVWLGQQVMLSFKYFRRIQPWNNPQFKAPRTEGFWREDLGQERRYRSVVGGRTYSVTEIRYALFPTRTGELTIEPAELSFPDQGLDRFFSSRRSRGPSTLRTSAVTINVKPLPTGGRPADFSGLVAAEVRLEAAVDRDSVPRGEPVDWKLQLVSDGFLQGFSGLNVPEPEGARTHDAGEGFATQVDGNRLLSAITMEKVIVPGQEGTLDVPQVELNWFDTRNGQYRTSRTPRLDLVVKPSNLPYLPEEDSGFLRSEVSRLAQDLAFIHNVPHHLRMGSWSPFSSWIWWAALVLPMLLLGGWRFYLVRLSAERRDPLGRRRRQALTAARASLKDAGQSNADRVTRLGQVARTVCVFVADCTGVPPAAVGPAEVAHFCAAHGSDGPGARLRALVEAAETARYGGGAAADGLGGTLDPQQAVGEAGQLLEDLWSRLDPGRSPGTRVGGLTALVLLALAACGLPPTANAQPDPARLMAEAGQAYTQGDLDQTLQLYLQAEQLGVQDPVLFFNLGNTYARRGELGLAVASYLQAQRLAPRDPDIRRNLAWVRGHIADLELGEQKLPLFIAQFVWLARAFTLAEWSVAVVILVWLLAGLVAWGWWREGFSDPLRRTALAVAALLLVTAAVFIWRWQGQEVRVQAVVVAQEVAVRSGPEESFPVLFQLHDGLTVEIEGRQLDWARISLGGESLGWLPLDSVMPVNPKHR